MEYEKPKKKRTFPTIPAIVLVTGILWLINDLHILTIDIPWFPVILIIVGIGLLLDFYKEK